MTIAYKTTVTIRNLMGNSKDKTENKTNKHKPIHTFGFVNMKKHFDVVEGYGKHRKKQK